MIIGTIALLAILFGGGLDEIFLIEGFEKGVKEYVVDKERQKDILSDLKISEEFIKEFDKNRKEDLKKFTTLNNSISTSKENMKEYFTLIMKEREAFQDSLFSQRIHLTKKINADEWKSIVDYSKTLYSKRIEKEQKKENKKKLDDYFQKTRKEIDINISDSLSIIILNDALDNMLFTFGEFAQEINNLNVEDSSVLVHKEVNKKNLLDLANMFNGARENIFNQIIDFHFLLKEQSSESSWDKLITTFSNELTLSNH